MEGSWIMMTDKHNNKRIDGKEGSNEGMSRRRATSGRNLCMLWTLSPPCYLSSITLYTSFIHTALSTCLRWNNNCYYLLRSGLQGDGVEGTEKRVKRDVYGVDEPMNFSSCVRKCVFMFCFRLLSSRWHSFLCNETFWFHEKLLTSQKLSSLFPIEKFAPQITLFRANP